MCIRDRPLYNGGSLQQLIQDDGPLGWEEACQMLLPVVEALAEAHSRGIMHLDLKPANVLLDDEGTPHLADFGIAEMMGSTASLSGAMITPSFTPPERLKGGNPSLQHDIYGIGATLFTVLHGHPPFGGATTRTPAGVVITSVLTEPAPIEELGDAVPENVKALLTWTLDKDPAQRPDSAQALAGLFHSVLAGEEIVAPSTVLADGDPTVDSASAASTAAVAGDPTRNSSLLTPNDPTVRAQESVPLDGTISAADLDVSKTPLVEEDNSGKRFGLWLAGAAAVLLLVGGVAAGLILRGGESNEVASAAADDEGLEETTTTAEPVEAEVAGIDTVADGSTSSRPGTTEDEEVTGDGEVDASDDLTLGDDAVTGSIDQGSNADPGVDTNDIENENDVADTVAAPRAEFAFSASTADAGEAIFFTSESTGAITSLQWQFGDGTTSTRSAPSHSFANAGTYTVTLRTTGPGGSDSTSAVVTINEVASPPSAGFSASDQTINAGETVSFTSSSSGDISSLSWAFGDGTTASGSSTSHTFPTAGSYTVRLTARGPGGSDSAVRTINVAAVVQANPPPAPNNIGCTFLDANNVLWAWSPLPALVDNYIVELSNGSRQTLGEQVGQFSTTDGSLSRIIAVESGVEAASNVGGCEAWGGTPPGAGVPDPPSGISCQFSNFFFNAAGVYTWTETWNWSNDSTVDFYQVRLNQDGNFFVQQAGGRSSHTTVGVNGQSNSGLSVKGIIAVRSGESNERSISNCGAMGGTGWVSP